MAVAFHVFSPSLTPFSATCKIIKAWLVFLSLSCRSLLVMFFVTIGSYAYLGGTVVSTYIPKWTVYGGTSKNWPPQQEEVGVFADVSDVKQASKVLWRIVEVLVSCCFRILLVKAVGFPKRYECRQAAALDTFDRNHEAESIPSAAIWQYSVQDYIISYGGEIWLSCPYSTASRGCLE